MVVERGFRTLGFAFLPKVMQELQMSTAEPGFRASWLIPSQPEDTSETVYHERFMVLGLQLHPIPSTLHGLVVHLKKTLPPNLKTISGKKNSGMLGSNLEPLNSPSKHQP